MSRIAEARRDGMRAVGDNITRGEACAHALTLTINEGDAFLAGYYAELVRLTRLFPEAPGVTRCR